MKKNVFTLFSFSIFIFIVFCTQKTFAQQVVLSVYPPLVEAMIKPGKDILIGYKIQNLGDPTVVNTRVVTFYPHGNQGNVQVKNQLEGPVRFSLENTDIQLGNAFFLKNNAEQQVLLKMRVPENAPEGDYYYTLLFESKPQADLTGNSASGARATIGANLLLTITREGTLDINGKINQFTVLPQYAFNLFGTILNIFDSGSQIPVILNIQNQGKNLIKPEGTITVNSDFGEKTQYLILPENILAESQRIAHATPSASLDRKDHSLILPGYFMGKYRIDAKVNFGEGTKELSDTVVIYSVPLKLTIAVILCVIVGYIIFKRYKKIED